MTRTAQEARQLAESNLRGHVIAEFIKAIDQKIETAIQGGKFKVVNPFTGIGRSPSSDERQRVIEHYTKKGYKYESHAGDCRDPRDSGYDELIF